MHGYGNKLNLIMSCTGAAQRIWHTKLNRKIKHLFTFELNVIFFLKKLKIYLFIYFEIKICQLNFIFNRTYR